MATPQAAHYTNLGNAEPYTGGISKKCNYEMKSYSAIVSALGWGIFVALFVGLILVIWPPYFMMRKKKNSSSDDDSDDNSEMCVCPRRVVATSLLSGLFVGVVVWLYSYSWK